MREASSLQLPHLIEQIVAQAEEQVIGHDGDDDFEDKNEGDDSFNGHDQARVADVARTREQHSPKGEGLLQKGGPATYAVFSQNLVLSGIMRF